jgi:hypothetical protein
MEGFKFSLGSTVQDKITGFTGIIRTRTEHLTGCKNYMVQNLELDSNGNPKEWVWLDEIQIVLIKKDKVLLTTK